MREGGEGGRVVQFESIVFLLKNSMIFDVFIFFFRFIPDLGLAGVVEGVGRDCEAVVEGGGGGVVSGGVGSDIFGLDTLFRQPTMCRGGTVTAFSIKGGGRVGEGEGGGGGGPRDIFMQLSDCGGRGREGLFVITRQPILFVTVGVTFGRGEGVGSASLQAGGGVRVEPGGGVEVGDVSANIPAGGGVRVGLGRGVGAASFSGRLHLRVGSSLVFVRSESFSCSRCILLLLLALDVCVGSEVLAIFLGCVVFSSSLASRAISSLGCTNVHLSTCVGCVVVFILLSGGRLLGDDVLRAVEAVGGFSFSSVIVGLCVGKVGVLVEGLSWLGRRSTQGDGASLLCILECVGGLLV